MYGIIDCDNCYVSCERVFRPDLEGKPVVVWSNNDGCVVARSNEAKKMGIKSGTPYFPLSSGLTCPCDMMERMTPEQARQFRDDVLNIVSQIPLGQVMTYGMIAAWAGWPSHSRIAGRTLRYTPGTESLVLTG